MPARQPHVTCTANQRDKTRSGTLITRQMENSTASRQGRTAGGRRYRSGINGDNFRDRLHRHPGVNRGRLAGRWCLSVPAEKPIAETTVFGVVRGGRGRLRTQRLCSSTTRPRTVHTALVGLAGFNIAGFKLSRNCFRMAADAEPVRQRMRTRMSQQRKDTPDGQHEKADETHRLESNRYPCQRKDRSYLRCLYVVPLQ